MEQNENGDDSNDLFISTFADRQLMRQSGTSAIEIMNKYPMLCENEGELISREFDLMGKCKRTLDTVDLEPFCRFTDVFDHVEDEFMRTVLVIKNYLSSARNTVTKSEYDVKKCALILGSICRWNEVSYSIILISTIQCNKYKFDF